MGFRIHGATAVVAVCIGTIYLPAQTVDLPSSKQLVGEIPGHPQRINSLPISMTVSPDGRYVVTVNAGYGTYESQYEQSFVVLDTQTGALADFPDARTAPRAHQTLFSGLAFSRDGSRLYASMASLTDAKGDGGADVGSGIAVYSFTEGKIAPERLIPLPENQLPTGRMTRLPEGTDSDEGSRIRLRLRSSARPATKNYWSPKIFPTMLSCSMPRRARSKSASIFLRAKPSPRYTRSLSPSPETASAPLLRCGTRRRSRNSISIAARWHASCRCSSRPVRLLLARIPARWLSRRMKRRFMSR